MKVSDRWRMKDMAIKKSGWLCLSLDLLCQAFGGRELVILY